MTVMLLVTVIVVGVYTLLQTSRQATQLSDKIIEQTSNQVDERIGLLLNKAESQAQLMAGFAFPTLAGNEMPALNSSHFPRMMAQMVEMIKVNAEFGSISMVLESSGEAMRVDQLQNAAVRAQTITLQADRGPVLETWVPFGDRFLAKDPQPSKEDLRQNPAYQACKRQEKVVWTETSIRPDLGGRTVPGVTCSTPIVGPSSRFLGVVSVTFTLNELSRYLKHIHVGQDGYAFLVEYPSNGTPRLIAHPNLERFLVTQDGRERPRTLTELSDPVVSALVSEVRDYRSLQAGSVQRLAFRVDGENWLGGFRTVSGDRSPRWALGVVVPSDEFLRTPRDTAIFFLSTAFLTLVVGLIVSVLFARRIAQPLSRLSEETRRIQNLELEARPFASTNIRELDDLATAMEKMKSSMRSLEKLVPSEYARWLISSGQEAKLGGERRNITTYFADIIGFTSLSQVLPPEELVEVLTEYLDVLSRVVLDHGGTIDKYNGDDVMAFWGAPTLTTDHAVAACRSAWNSRKAIETLHDQWRLAGRPLMSASFGICTGEVVVGNVGSRQRMNYTVIGDSVNMASRLQGLNKSYDTSILICQNTCEQAGDAILARKIEMVYILGREEPAAVYELMAVDGDITPALRKLVEVYEAGYHFFLARDWAAAESQMEAVLRLNPVDGPAIAILKRIERYKLTPPPEDWDGTSHMQLK